ncbi:glycosyltransferase WbuB [Pseudohongiella acticola]|uniref:Glycosyltransferase WbuB n=1 Tax=Pseudohongiella acticola TaxID=1524254 RepID=A0A1E8CH63_9GAMM|nr:glycosyltransferase family 4 protein [Pseudohongiella acticola]OFE11766.1 glycosyltransferase WbuB [Pseudohongiella acticola]
MRIALIADTFPPLRSSGAVQLRDLSREFVRQGHEITVMVASPQQTEPWLLEDYHGVQVLRLHTPRIKDVSYVRRTMAELLMPFYMKRNLQRSPLAAATWDAVVWYSPSIFLAPLVNFLKKRHQIPGYLIIRDIFPEWAVDMGLMGRGLPYRFFRTVADYQYSAADIIGVQTPGNRVYFEQWLAGDEGRVEVLQNWLSDTGVSNCSIRIADTALAGKRIFVYAGNMGVAQGMNTILAFAQAMSEKPEVGFVFVGRGSDSERLRAEALRRKLDNVLFFDEIDPDEIPGLYQQCDVGIVALDVRHKTHNIPGKFISYMQAGLPVLAMINPGNDLQQLIVSNNVGVVSTQADADVLTGKASELLSRLESDQEISGRCRSLYEQLFAPEIAVSQIVRALQS